MADWATVTAYLFAAALSARAAARAKLGRDKRGRLFWHILAGLMVFLGINELLDLQTLLTIAGREYAKSAGWYGAHRAVQYIFVLGLTGFTGATGLATIWLTRCADFTVHMALSGLVFIGLFVLLRASSFHHLDELIGRETADVNWGSMPEVTGIAIIAWAASLYPRRRDYQL